MTLLSLYLTSTKLAKRYCLSIFNIIDVASVGLLLFTETALTTDPTLLDNEGFAASLTIVLLWLKVMGAFKVLNSAFSLFLYAVNEVIKDVIWFIVFLFGITLMFSDAARTIVAARGDCNIDGDQFVVDEFCSDNLLAVIIRMYSVLVGDVALEYFQSSNAMIAVRQPCCAESISRSECYANSLTNSNPLSLTLLNLSRSLYSSPSSQSSSF